MKPEQLAELQRRAETFKSWLEEPATKLYFEIINNKVVSLERQVSKMPKELHRAERRVSYNKEGSVTGETCVTEITDIKSRTEGKIEGLREMAYMPIGAIKTLERAENQDGARPARRRTFNQGGAIANPVLAEAT